MSRVLARRDENWKKLQQDVLEERESLQLIGRAARRSTAFAASRRGFHATACSSRAPLRADGVEIGEAERRKAEAVAEA